MCNCFNRQVSDLQLRTCKLWDISTGKCLKTLTGHTDEVLDLNFNRTGTRMVTASADGTARVYNVNTSDCSAVLECTSFITKSMWGR